MSGVASLGVRVFIVRLVVVRVWFILYTMDGIHTFESGVDIVPVGPLIQRITSNYNLINLMANIDSTTE